MAIAACVGAVLHSAQNGWLELGTLLTALLALVPVAFGYGYLSWWFTTFRIEGDDLRIDSGVVFRRTRHLRLTRLEAVDVVRPFAARLLGLARLQLQVAGGDSAEAGLSYLSEGDAQALRAELLARGAGIDPRAGEAPENELIVVPFAALAGSVALSVSTWVLVLPGLALVTGAVVTGEYAALVGFVPLFLLAWRSTAGRVLRHFDFTVAESPDGLRLRHGLLEQRHQTVPPGRVQAARIVQPWLWRRRGWVRVEVNIAGYGDGDDEKEETVLLPVAPREVAHALLARVLPGVDLASVPLTPVPRRARWRHPVGRRGLAYGADEKVFVACRGVLRREVAVIPHAKVQSVRRTQGPWERRLSLATVHLDSTPGPVRVRAVARDADEASRMVDEQAGRSRTSRGEVPSPGGPPARAATVIDDASGQASSPGGSCG